MLDDRLLAFSLKLPTDYKLKGLKLRWFFKEALRGFLPDEILTKKKQGFGLPFGVWANTHPALKALATDSLHSLAKRGVVRADFIADPADPTPARAPGLLRRDGVDPDDAGAVAAAACTQLQGSNLDKHCPAVLFTTATFICLFLPIVLTGFFCIARISHATAALWLFVASVFFYGYWMPEFTVLLLASISGNFLIGGKNRITGRYRRLQEDCTRQNDGS